MLSLAYFIMDFFQAHKPVFVLIGIGMVAGLLSQLILPGRGFGILATIGIGISGALIGDKFLAPHMEFIEDSFFRTIAAATTATMIISVVINLIRGGEDKDLTHWRDR